MYRRLCAIGALCILMVLPQASCGGTIAVLLTDLIGNYTADQLPMFIESRQALVETDYPSSEVYSARLVIIGNVTPGILRGNGIIRAAQDAVLQGAFIHTFAAGNEIMAEFVQQPQIGPFHVETEYPGPFFSDPSIVGTSGMFEAAVYLDFGPFSYSLDLVPWLVERPEDDWQHWFDGLEVVTPLTGTITEAYLVLEGPNLPEPATLSLLALGVLAILRRRKVGVRKTR